MEKNFSFPTSNLDSIVVKTSWPQLEVNFSKIENINLFIAGDNKSVMQIEPKQSSNNLVIEQPQYGLNIDYKNGSWMQIVLNIPIEYKGKLSLNTVSGNCLLHGYNGSELVIDTISAGIIINNIKSDKIKLFSVNGSITAKNIDSNTIKIKTINGKTTLENVYVKKLTSTSVTAPQQYDLIRDYEKIEINSVTGDIEILQPYKKVNANVRSAAACIHYDNVTNEVCDQNIKIHAVSANVKIKCNNKGEF